MVTYQELHDLAEAVKQRNIKLDGKFLHIIDEKGNILKSYTPQEIKYMSYVAQCALNLALLQLGEGYVEAVELLKSGTMRMISEGIEISNSVLKDLRKLL